MRRLCAIVAADVITALGDGIETVWSRMLEGESGVRPLRRFPIGKYRTDVAGEIPAEVEASVCANPGTRAYDLALRVARRVAGPGDTLRQGVPGVGLVLSSTKGEVGDIERLARDGASGGRFNLHRMACDLANALDLGGPVLAVSNACASGLAAIIQAARMVQRGQARAMVVVGVDVLADFIIAGFSSLGALSRGCCRPYDRDRDGLSLGEGAGAVLVAEADACDVAPLGLIRGWGVSNDAHHITGPSRTGEGLKQALWGALDMADLGPDAVQYVNGHGTGTIYNDEMEAHAFHAVFGDAGAPVTSMKGYFGHTLGAAGIIEAALCLMAIRDKTIPASVGLERLGVSKPIHVLREKVVLERLERVVTVKSGFGGVNAALAMAGSHPYD